MKAKALTQPLENIAELIRTIRGEKVILDADLARIYGVETKTLNRAIRRNLAKFPDDFLFVIAREELTSLRCQNGTSNVGRGGRRHLPYAFTEHGALMAANILRSPRAVAMSIYVIRAFVKMRQDQAANAAILKRLAEIDKTLLTHNAALRDIYQKLLPLLTPPPEAPKRKIGFHVQLTNERGPAVF